MEAVKTAQITHILLRNNDKFNKKIVLGLCSYFSLSELAKYARISKLFYEISGHRKVLKMFAEDRNRDFEMIGLHGMLITLIILIIGRTNVSYITVFYLYYASQVANGNQ